MERRWSGPHIQVPLEVQIPACRGNDVEVKCEYNFGHMTGGRLNTGDTISFPD